jgi:predicted branched-subunit amino acid permease
VAGVTAEDEGLPSDAGDGSDDRSMRRTVVVDALAIGVATGAYGLSFGALAVTAGLSLPEAMALSLLMFTGASQFAFVGLATSGGAAAATAVLLGARNAFYGVSLAPLLRARGLRRPAAAHLVIDESTAMAIGQPTAALARLGFYATGLAVFGLWNLGTLAGVVGARLLADPRVLGFDAAAPAAFLALLAPRLRGHEPWTVALAAAAVAVGLTPFVPAGVPVLAAAGVAGVAVLVRPSPTSAFGPPRPAAGPDGKPEDRTGGASDPESAA